MKFLKGLGLCIISIVCAFLLLAAGTQIYKLILGGMDVRLIGTEWDQEKPMVPGETIDVHPAAKNDSKRVGAYVFISLSTTYALHDSGKPTELFGYDVNDGWAQVDEEWKDGAVVRTFAYGTEEELAELPAGETTVPVMDGIVFELMVRQENLPSEGLRRNFDIRSVGSNFNAKGKAAKEVWESVKWM